MICAVTPRPSWKVHPTVCAGFRHSRRARHLRYRLRVSAQRARAGFFLHPAISLGSAWCPPPIVLPGCERLLNSGHGQDLLCAIGQRGDHAAGGPQDIQHHAGGPRLVGLGQCLEISGGEGGLQAHGRWFIRATDATGRLPNAE